MSMFTPLSKRLNPESVCLSYPNTTPGFKNQMTSVILEFIHSLDSNILFKQSRRFVEDYECELCRSIGVDVYNPSNLYSLTGLKYHLEEYDGESYLDALDIFIQLIYSDSGLEQYVEDCGLIEDINSILKSNGVDLRVCDGMCIRISEPTIQEEVISPAFSELGRAGFMNAQSDLIEAFRHFKEGNNPSAIHSANKALESTIAYLIEKHGITVPKDKMSSKIEALIRCGAIPREYETVINSLVNVLQFSGITRNKKGGHGTSDEKTVDDCYAQLAIDSAASAILFLVRLYEGAE